VADALRQELLAQRESFVFETVFSDPVGDKLPLLKEAAGSGYTVLLCFSGIADPEVSRERVSMHVSQSGHDAPDEKIASRFSRTLASLAAAIRELPHVFVFDNDDLTRPFRRVAVFEGGRLVESSDPLPAWLQPLLP
jgi:predicted ABC-type ATPase